MNLLLAEWQRFFARRFTRIMLLFIVVLMVVIAIGIGHGSHKLTSADFANARAHAAAENAQSQQDLAACLQAQTAGTATEGTQYFMPPGVTCADEFGFADAQPAWFMPSSWVFADQGGDMILLFGGILALLGFAAGASFMGAEWSSGGMANLLLWRPRRLSLLGGKLLALLLSVLASGLVLGALWLGMLLLIAVTRGSIGHVSTSLGMSLALGGVRSLTLGLFAAVAGFAIGSIGRNTASALGVAVGYVVIVEGGGLLILKALDVTRPERFLLSRYVAAWLTKTQTISGTTVCTQVNAGGSQCSSGADWFMRMGSAAEVGGLIAAILLVWAFGAFWRRDVS